jgi:peptidoglycan/LPS O-acetylase OafA/YrhL
MYFRRELLEMSDTNLSGSRVLALDGLRAIAILLVMGFHYFNDFIALKLNLYPYKDAFAGFPIFLYGMLGVQLFFLISGFVIALTLENCNSPYEFFVRRFARIWPALLVCSIITFLIMKASSSPYSASRELHWPNFLPSLTLTPAELWSTYFPGVDFVDNVYWSLLIEARFYVIAVVVFWSFKRSNFAQNLIVFTYISILFRAALQRIIPGSNEIYSLILVPDFMPWFAAGAVFYELFTNRMRPGYAVVLLCSMIVIIFRTSTFVGDPLSPLIVCIFAALFFAAFWLVATKSSIARCLETRALVWVGICSYSVYLLHNSLGKVMLTSIPKDTPIGLQFTFIIAVAAVMISVGYVSFILVEQPARRLVTSILLAKRLQRGPPNTLSLAGSRYQDGRERAQGNQ